MSKLKIILRKFDMNIGRWVRLPNPDCRMVVSRSSNLSTKYDPSSFPTKKGGKYENETRVLLNLTSVWVLHTLMVTVCEC